MAIEENGVLILLILLMNILLILLQKTISKHIPADVYRISIRTSRYPYFYCSEAGACRAVSPELLLFLF